MGLPVAAAVGVSTSVAANKMTAGDADHRDVLDLILTELRIANRYADVERRRTLYPIQLGPGITSRNAGPVKTHSLIFTGGTAGDVFQLVHGAAGLFTFIAGGNIPVTLPIPLLLTSEFFIRDVTTPAATNWQAFLLAYRDEGIGLHDER